MDNSPIENKIKEYLDQRSLDPSPMAWDRLDSMLSVTESRKPKKLPIFMSVAASITLLLTVALWLHYAQTPVKYTGKLIVVNQLEENKIKVQDQIIQDIPNPKQPSTIQISKSSQYLQRDKKSFTDAVIANSNEKDIVDKSTISVGGTPSIYSTISDLNPSFQPDKNVVINNKVENNVVSGLKIDSDQLLKSVENTSKISSQSVTSSKYGLDPQKLLWEAENTPEKKLISKIFKSIQENSGPVFAAVSERNEVKSK